MIEKKINLIDIYKNYACDEVNLYVNDICNANCKYCCMAVQKANVDTDKEMSKETFDTILDKIKDNDNIKKVCFQGKEPSLWKYIDYGIEECKKMGKQVIYYTNGINKRKVYPDDIILHIDEDFLENDLAFFREHTKQNNINLTFVVVLNKDSDIDKYFEIITTYCDNVDLSFAFYLNYNEEDKKSIAKMIALFKKLYNIGFRVELDIAIPYCLLSEDDLEFLESNNIKFSGTCYSTDIHQITPMIDCDGKYSYPCIGMKDRREIGDVSIENLWKNHFKYLHKLRRTMPMKKCYECKYYKNNSCHGGCLVNREK